MKKDLTRGATEKIFKHMHHSISLSSFKLAWHFEEDSSDDSHLDSPVFVYHADAFLDFDSFFAKFALLNRPTLVPLQHCSDVPWQCVDQWSNGPHLDSAAVLSKFGAETLCPIAFCDEEKRTLKDASGKVRVEVVAPHFLPTGQERTEMSLQEYFSILDAKEPCRGNDLPYLKDWHMQKQFPDANVYTTPLFASDDWLNRFFCQTSNDDYRFCYIGKKGTWTALHFDVLKRCVENASGNSNLIFKAIHGAPILLGKNYGTYFHQN